MKILIKVKINRLMNNNNFVKKVFYRLKKGEFPLLLNPLLAKHVFHIKPFVSPVFFESINMYLRLGYWPKLKNPRTINEKIVNQKLFINNPLFSQVADKVKVRKYVSDKIGENVLNELYFVGNDPRLIPFESLPNQFIIKTNHGSGWNIIVKDKSKIDKSEIIEKCNYWLSLKYSDYSKGYEAHYDSIAPSILVEKFLSGKDNNSILDYKFFCFHGRVNFIAVDTDKYTKQNRLIYDVNWNPIDFSWPNLPKENQVQKPQEIREMIQIAESLSHDFDFCRIDLYLSNTGIKFGEITISPGGGWDKITPKEADFILGKLWGSE